MEAVVLDAIASPRRREILRLVWQDEQTAGAIHRAMPDVTFGAVSLQLQFLLKAGLLESRTQQRNRFYRARREVLGSAAQILESMWDDALWKLKLAAELEETGVENLCSLLIYHIALNEQFSSMPNHPPSLPF
jgi:DNA-binding transcriptional ArsR family regulator